MSRIFETEAQKHTLLERFKHILTLGEKFKFWEIELKTKYITYLLLTGISKSYTEETSKELWEELYEFEIVPDDPKEIEQYNKRILEEYIYNYDSALGSNKVMYLDNEIEKYSKGYEKAINKKGFIELEIDRMKQIVKDNSVLKQGFPFDNRGDFFKHEYEAVYVKGEAYDYSKQYFQYQNLIALNNGRVSAEYMLFLENERQKHSDTPKDLASVHELNTIKQRVDELKQQVASKKAEKRPLRPSQLLLLFHHLDLIEPVLHLDMEGQQKAKLIATLLDVGAENVEKNMNKLGTGDSEFETEKNYEVLIDFLEEVGVKNLIKEINSKKIIKR